MTKRDPLTWDRLPLFATDEEIGEAVLGWARKDEFKGLAVLQERHGMPKMNPLWGGRYVPAVKAFLDHQYGIGQSAAVPLAPDGIEGDIHEIRESAKKRRPQMAHAQIRPTGPVLVR